jgi:hypothetical protein
MRWKAHVRFLGGENPRGSTYPNWVGKLILHASLVVAFELNSRDQNI